MFWRRRVRDRDLDREIQAHLELEAEDNRERGLSPREAERAARRALGNAALLKENVRENWGFAGVERFVQDVRYGLRLLRKNPGFSAVAILSLALGIGANTAIFSLIDSLLYKPLPIRDPQSLLYIAKDSGHGPDPSFYYQTYARLRSAQTWFQDVAAYAERVRMNVSIDGAPESTMGELVSGNYYSVLGISPAAGRLFGPDDDRVPGGDAVAVVSYSYWQRRFAGSPDAIGKSISISGTPFTIVGVTPAGFAGLQIGDAPDLVVPVMMQPAVMPDAENWLERPRNTVDWLTLFGRLRPGVTIPQATGGLQGLFHSIQTQLATELDLDRASWRNEWVDGRIVLAPGATGLSHLRREYSVALYILMAIVGLVLLIACANVANLLLARAASRQREIALRLAIGAGRARLVRQLLVESVILSGLGGAMGIAISFWATRLLMNFLSEGRSPITLNLAPDWRVLAFTAAVSVAAGILFGIAPAWRGASLQLSSALKIGGRGSSPSQRFARSLCMLQVALSLVLLTGTGLLLRTLHNVNSVDGGFPRDRVYTVSLAPEGSGQKNGPNGSRLNRLYLDLLDRVRGIPGVASASLAGDRPTFRGYTRPYRTTDGRQFRASQNQIYPGYFETLGSAMVQGRDFTRADMLEGAPLVAVVNQTLARTVFPGESAIGKRVFCSGRITVGELGAPCEIIGVARDVPYSTLKDDPEPAVYMPFLQCPTGRGGMELLVRGALGGDFIPAQLRRQIASTDSRMPAFIYTLAAEIDSMLMRERLLALISTVFAGLAALLAAIGLYGVVAYSVSRRSQEIGVRMALGAVPGRVQGLIVRETIAITVAGIACGVPASLAATRLLSSFLRGVRPGDPATYIAACGLLLATAAIAGMIPARRAARIDPATALRNE